MRARCKNVAKAGHITTERDYVSGSPMHDFIAACRYLQPPAHSFWKWGDDGDVVEWNSGGTISFREQVRGVLTPFADFQYKCTDLYDPSSEVSLAWNDPTVGIDWPLTGIGEPALSGKDKEGLAWDQAPKFA